MPHALWDRQGPRELTTVAVHQVEAADGTRNWERVTTVYDAQGYATAKTEPWPITAATARWRPDSKLSIRPNPPPTTRTWPT